MVKYPEPGKSLFGQDALDFLMESFGFSDIVDKDLKMQKLIEFLCALKLGGTVRLKDGMYYKWNNETGNIEHYSKEDGVWNGFDCGVNYLMDHLQDEDRFEEDEDEEG